MGPSPDEMWEWVEHQAAYVPAWGEERWQRVNAIFGVRLADERAAQHQQKAA